MIGPQDSQRETDVVASNFDLTPAAEELLALYSERYRQRVIEEAHKIQGGSTSDKIRLKSVQSALEGGDRGRVERILKRSLMPANVYLLVTLAIALVVSAVYLNSEAGAERSYLVSSIVSLSAMLVSFYVLVSSGKSLREARTVRTRATDRSAAAFIRAIGRLELTARRVAAPIAQADVDTMSLSDVLNALESTDVWNSSDSTAFRDVLKLRNSVVHEAQLNIEFSEFSNALMEVWRLTKKLESHTSPYNSLVSISAAHFEKMVGDALVRVLGGASVTQVADDSGYDYLVEAGSELIRVDVKYRRVGTLTKTDLLKIADRSYNRSGPGTLVITNFDLSEHAMDLNWSSMLKDRKIDVVSWSGPEDDHRIAESVIRLAAGAEENLSAHAKFEIYRDARGEFRFRLKAANGEMLAVSEGYGTRSEIIQRIRAARRAMSEADAVDRT